MTTTAPTLNARVIALAFRGPRTLLDGTLADLGTDFAQSVVLRTVAGAGGSADRAALAAEVGATLQAEEPAVRAVIERLTAAQLLDQGRADAGALRLTEAGRDLHERISAASAGIAARLYADIPAEDLAVAGRVLTLITERAEAELARA
ncbi:winged helix DNA-binding protein [Kitasatospora viridis]|uniref:Winged helix DNA-binding protein n=1 Tax=Kitasatospora viridis TaxID=281105 RepID=A0A561SEF5_9ACTN|nr:winged helix DNA-binding protein [Kitasatospora viridis]TWF73245.1 winged helix DNA-binding protein [Kitasatospora viridis]